MTARAPSPLSAGTWTYLLFVSPEGDVHADAPVAPGLADVLLATAGLFPDGGVTLSVVVTSDGPRGVGTHVTALAGTPPEFTTPHVVGRLDRRRRFV